MGPPAGGPARGAHISEDGFHRLAEKIVRGIFYVVDRKFIEPPFAVESFPLDPSSSGPVREVLDRFAVTYAREPGIVVRRAVTEDGVSSLFEIEFWGQLERYGASASRLSGEWRPHHAH